MTENEKNETPRRVPAGPSSGSARVRDALARYLGVELYRANRRAKTASPPPKTRPDEER